MIELEWMDVPAGEYEIGLRPDEARALAERIAKEARAAAADDPDQLHPGRERERLDEMWGNVEFLYAQLAHSLPAHQVALPAFSITKTPVTLRHYTEFRIKTGAAPRATSAGSEAWALVPDPPSPTQPVTGISWDEAVAFASWAGGQLPAEAMWEAALRPSRSPFGPIGHEDYEWCADEFGPYPGADRIAFGRIAPPPGGWWGTRTRRAGVIPGFPVTVVTRRGADPKLRLRDTTFRLVKR